MGGGGGCNPEKYYKAVKIFWGPYAAPGCLLIFPFLKDLRNDLHLDHNNNHNHSDDAKSLLLIALLVD